MGVRMEVDICGEETLLTFLAGLRDDNLNGPNIVLKPLYVKLKNLFFTFKGLITLSVVKINDIKLHIQSFSLQ